MQSHLHELGAHDTKLASTLGDPGLVESLPLEIRMTSPARNSR
ncbi:hypothetical protein [Sphingobium herbicidovorans]|nr:hypothetical protein [Sphingobium herbicidovorans]